MYKLLLCWRYLRTRYLALVCIVSVMLGVATLIVVNSVMGGFSTKLKERLHGLLSDVVIESPDFSPFEDPEGKMARIRNDPVLGSKVEAMTASHEIFGVIQHGHASTPPRPVRLIGIDPVGRSRVGGFQEFLVSKDRRENPALTFELDQAARRRYGTHRLLEGGPRPALSFSDLDPSAAPPVLPPAPPGPVPSGKWKPLPEAPEWHFQPHVPHSVVVGYSIAHYRRPAAGPDHPAREECTLQRGDTIVLITMAGQKLRPVYDRLVVSDYIKTEMSEYDNNYVFVPLDYLQRLRGMDDKVTTIHVKLKDYADARPVVARLNEILERDGLVAFSWEEKQGPLLAAISIEKGILNVLLFLIIAVAGFGILAIFSMIVVEKTRDIGILKALGASRGGVMKIFLSYGLLLGLVGAGLGTVMGLTFTHRINEIEKFLTHLTGQEVFDRNIYYFDRIPTHIEPLAVLLVNLGAVAIAVLFSVLPALRAAMLHPVRALRYE